MDSRIVRVATLNLAGIGHAWFEGRSKAVVSGLQALRPDVVVFQETTMRTDGPTYDQARTVGAAIGLEMGVFAPYGNPIEIMSAEQGGVALASRWPIRHSQNRRLPEGTRHVTDNRVALIATLLAPWGDLTVATTHLSWRAEEAETRLVQMGMLLGDLRHAGRLAPRSPLVLAGDLNATEDEAAIQLATSSMIDCFRTLHPDEPGYTWVKSNPWAGKFPMPDRRLDYIFCTPGADTQEADVVLDQPDPVYPSDHYGVMAAIAFAG